MEVSMRSGGDHNSSSSTHQLNPQSFPLIPITNKTNKTPHTHQNFNWVYPNKGLQHPIVEKFEVGSSNFAQGMCEKEENEEGVDKVGSLLEEMVLCEEEIELDEEVLRINDQLQEDELLAMESIYGDDIFILQNYNGLRSFQIHVHIEARREFLISTNLNLSKNIETNLDPTNEFPNALKVQYLPPIILTCVLPKSYPSHHPPYFTIFVQWLESSKISNLCSMLDSIWKEQPPGEVLYQWGEWLQSSALSFLGFDEEIILGPNDAGHTVDKRAFSGFVSPEVDIASVMIYNEEKLNDNFCKNLHECCICFSEYSGTDFMRLPCQHFFCRKCMKTFSEMHVKEGTINKLLCPDTKCDGIIPLSLLKQILDDKFFARWESFMLQKTLESMSDVVNCPRCETACIVDEEQHAQCPKCFFSFCPLCKDRRHVGLPCLSVETKLLDLQEQQASVQHKGQLFRQNRKMQELLSIHEIFRDAKQCPSCKMAISRTEGCDAMNCRNCGTRFCYRCNKRIYTRFGHYGLCSINSVDEIEYQKLAKISAQSTQRCPSCSHINIKFNNDNQIICKNCRKRFCYMCGKPAGKDSGHFKGNDCVQFTQRR